MEIAEVIEAEGLANLFDRSVGLMHDLALAQQDGCTIVIYGPRDWRTLWLRRKRLVIGRLDRA